MVVFEDDGIKCKVPEKSCLLCERCTDYWWDYTNGPYMFFCNYGEGAMLTIGQGGTRGNCENFIATDA